MTPGGQRGGRPGSAERREGRSMIRQSSLTSLVAGGSVLTGLLLDAVVAAKFGAGRATDSFFVAARIPLGLNAVVVAAANQALVPAISKSLVTRTEKETWKLVSTILTTLIVSGALMVALSAAVALPLVRVTAPGLPPAEAALAASLTPVVFLMVPLVSCSEVLRALLNARFSFVAPAATGLVLNGVSAGLILLLAHRNIHVVAWAYAAGAAAQVSFMLLFSLMRGFRFRPSLRVSDPHVTSVGRLCVRPLIASGANPLARVGEQLMVSFLPPGSITILAYGYRLISAVGGTVFFRSVIVAMVPRLTRAFAVADSEAVIRMTRLGLRVMLALAVPLTALMAVLARPAATVIFQRGGFTRADAALLGAVLSVYSASLIGSALQRALLAPFFAKLDTRTPLRNTLYGVGANLLLLPVMVLPWGPSNPEAVLGVAVAYSVAQYVNVGHALYRSLAVVGDPFEGSATFILRLVFATAVSAAVMIALTHPVGLDAHHNRWVLLMLTSAVAVAGLAALATTMGALAGRELSQSWIALKEDRRAAASQ